MPACPLATVIYRFDDASRFPVFESHTTAKGSVTVQSACEKPSPLGGRGLGEGGDFVRIGYERTEADETELAVVLALPLVAVDGRPRQLLLDVLGDASGCHLRLEGMDAEGGISAFSFGAVAFQGWRTLRADASKPVPPLQFHRLRITAAPSFAALRLGLRSLSLTGPVRFVPPGLARSVS
ncbi:MAG: hypothetical protein V1790_03965 [Planctomycetota bacterium]